MEVKTLQVPLTRYLRLNQLALEIKDLHTAIEIRRSEFDALLFPHKEEIECLASLVEPVPNISPESSG